MNADAQAALKLGQPNLNYLWSAVLIEELRRQGVGRFFVAPGSRSAPLSSAIGRNRWACSTVHFDERSLAYMACGYVAASSKPAALVCTSGTAAANFLPAVIEASKKKLPLILLTADRPPELQKTGAPQTIEQHGLFDPYVRWSFDLPCPTKQISPRFILTTAAQLVSRAKGELPGPVHVNVMFREPLSALKQNTGLSRYTAEIKDWAVSGKVYTAYAPCVTSLAGSSIEDALLRLGGIRKAVILAGKLASPRDREAVVAFAERTGFPVFPDVTSGLRLGHEHPNVIPYFDQMLLDKKIVPDFDGVIHFGGRMTSKRCYEMLAALPLKEYLMVLHHPLRSDPLHQVTARFAVSPSAFVEAMLPHLPAGAGKDLPKYQRGNAKASHAIDKTLKLRSFLESGVAKVVSRLIPAGEGLFLSNSMPIRDMDMYGAHDGAAVSVGANRGASGIDGIISSAAGFALGLGRSTTLMIGDLAFLYDLSALALLNATGQKLVIVVLNNNGGRIFSHLPVASDKAVFEKFFRASHGLSFSGVAGMFGLAHDAPSSLSAFERSYLRALRSNRSTIIEIKTS